MLRSFLGLLFLALIAAAPAWAAEQSPKLALKITSEKEVKTVKDGREVIERAPATNFKNGDVIVYTITYKNEGSSDAKDAEIVDPVPEGTVYILGSAEGKNAEVTFSMDGGRTYGKAPLKQAVKKPDGSVEERDAPAEAYTGIKWLIKKVAPGVSGKVSFKVRVK